MIKIEKLIKTYQTNDNDVTGVKGISFELHNGKATALCGESGCGKTTSAFCLAGLITPDSGKILVNDIDVLSLKINKRKALLRSSFQVIFQNTLKSLHPAKKIKRIFRETLFYLHKSNPGKIINVKNTPRKELERIYYDILNKVNLSPDSLENYPCEFSGGEIQRICIARALIANPQFLIADEPVSCLDVTTQAKILNLIKEIVSRENMGLLFITHDLAAAHYICDDVIIMEKGIIRDKGSVKDVLEISKNVTDYTKKLLKGMMLDDNDN